VLPTTAGRRQRGASAAQELARTQAAKADLHLHLHFFIAVCLLRPATCRTMPRRWYMMMAAENKKDILQPPVDPRFLRAVRSFRPIDAFRAPLARQVCLLACAASVRGDPKAEPAESSPVRHHAFRSVESAAGRREHVA